MSRYLLGSPRAGFTNHSNPERFLQDFESALFDGQEFVASVGQSAAFMLKQVNALLREHGIELRLDVNSQPEAADYVVNALVGGAIGAAGGVAAGAAVWGVARVAAMGTPLAPFLLVGGVIGLLTGAATGIAVTHWGLSVRFHKVTGNLEMAFSPIQ